MCVLHYDWKLHDYYIYGRVLPLYCQVHPGFRIDCELCIQNLSKAPLIMIETCQIAKMARRQFFIRPVNNKVKVMPPWLNDLAVEKVRQKVFII